MEEQEASVSTGYGCSVDPSNTSTDDPRTPPSGQQVESDSVLGSESGLDDPVEDAVEVTPCHQDSNLNQTLEDQLQAALKDLKKEMPKEQYANVELMFKIYKDQSPADKLLSTLLEHFQYIQTLHQKGDKATKTTSWFTKPYTMRVFPMVTGKTFGADTSILEQVQKGHWNSRVEITSLQQDCDIIILFCPITSRVGTDVDAAMKKVTGQSSVDKPVLLVLMHHTRHADYSVDVKKWSETYGKVVLGVHVLFHETVPGLLKCWRNDQALNHIHKELKRHSK